MCFDAEYCTRAARSPQRGANLSECGFGSPPRLVTDGAEGVAMTGRGSIMAAKPFDVGAAWVEAPQPQELILTLLADNVRNRLDRVWSGGLSRVAEEFGFSSSLVRASLARLARRNLIARQKRGRFVYYYLPPRAEQLFSEGDRRIFTLGDDNHVDGKVTVLIHSMPADMHYERARLSRRLRFLGFGSPQDGVWLCAGHRQDEIIELLEELEVSHYHSIIIGNLLEWADSHLVIDNAWNFARLNERYEAYVRTFDEVARRPPASDREALLIRTVATHNYRQFPALDPGINDAVHPSPVHKTAAIALFERIHDDFAEAAHRYFDDAVRHTREE